MRVELPPAMVRAGAAALLVLTLVYQTKGTVDLVWGTSPGSAIDLRNRDCEMALFTAGRNPYDYTTGTHPPWGYAAATLLTWPEWPAVRAYFAVANLVALAGLMVWAFHAWPSGRPAARWLLAGAVAAFGGSCTATEVGQVGIVVAALLAGALWADARGHGVLSGLLVGAALLKPTISAPFAVALLLTGRYRASLAAAAYGVVASAVCWGVTGVAPWVMLGQLAGVAGSYANEGTFGLVQVLAPFVPPALQNPLAALLVTVPGVVLMLRHRGSLPVVFAIAAVWGRLWTYHKSYDDVMLAFLLVPLGVLALAAPTRLPAVVAFGAVGVLAWLPGRFLAVEAVQIAQLAVWPTALALLATSNAGAVSAAKTHASTR